MLYNIYIYIYISEMLRHSPWHVARRILARPGTAEKWHRDSWHGTARHWHGTPVARHEHGTAWNGRTWHGTAASRHGTVEHGTGGVWMKTARHAFDTRSARHALDSLSLSFCLSLFLSRYIYNGPRTPWLGDLAWEILPRSIWAGWAGPDPIFFGGPHPVCSSLNLT